MPETLVFVRHGRTEWNQAGRYQGWADIELDEVGLGQAEAAAAALAARSVAPDLARAVVLTSDLRRATATAQRIASVLQAPVVEHAGLREVDLGEWEGLTRAEAEARFPEDFRRWDPGGEERYEVRRGGGETLAEAGRRFVDALSDGLERAVASGRWTPGAGEVFVVAHGLVLQAALRELALRGGTDFTGTPPHLANAEHLAIRFDWKKTADLAG